MAAPNVLQPYIQNYTATFQFIDGEMNADKTEVVYRFKKNLGDLSSNKYCILIKPSNKESLMIYNKLKITASTPTSGGILFSTNLGFINQLLLQDSISIDITIITDTNQ